MGRHIEGFIILNPKNNSSGNGDYERLDTGEQVDAKDIQELNYPPVLIYNWRDQIFEIIGNGNKPANSNALKLGACYVAGDVKVNAAVYCHLNNHKKER